MQFPVCRVRVSADRITKMRARDNGTGLNHRINLHPVDSTIGFSNTYPQDRDSSDG